MNNAHRRSGWSGTLAALAIGLLSGCSSSGWHRDRRVPQPSPEEQAAATLDAFHRAAARADEVTYFDLLTEDAVFLGTDPAERWDKHAFRDWSAEYFARDSAWTYEAIERHVTIGPRAEVAWFDEVVRNATYGDLRGTGVLVRDPASGAGTRERAWKISQYNLTFLVPNDLAPRFLELISQAN